MRSSRFNRLVIIQSNTPTQDSTTGNMTDSWAAFVTEWAAFRPLTVREFMAGGLEQGKTVGIFEMHYVSGVLPSMRLVDGDHTYNIDGVLPDDRTGVTSMMLPVSEVVDG
jgi:head-tail adaptor